MRKRYLQDEERVPSVGAGHHGPDEWVSISSLSRYRQALTEFVRQLPSKLAEGQAAPLRAVEGGLS